MSSPHPPPESAPTAAVELAYIGLGGNVGDVVGHFRRALAGLSSAGRVTAVSRLYRTQALLAPGVTEAAPDFWNAACCVQTALSPLALLDVLQRLEREAGRLRHERWGPRTLDLDLLLFGTHHVTAENLCVPHPELHKRPFVLLPLMDLDPNVTVPPAGRTVASIVGDHTHAWTGIRETHDIGWLIPPV